jgi:ribonuclease P protein component
LATAQRLRRRGEFAAAIRAGHRAARGVLVVHLMLPERPLPEPVNLAEPARTQVRAGFVVPKSVGGAVERNRVKRRLRHLVRERLAQFPAGTDVVVRALPGAADRGYPGLSSDLDAALTAARRRKPARR